MRIAFVCTGNICRSPMAESVARTLIDEAGLGDEVHVESFGTSGYHAGEATHRQTDPALARHGWPYGGHRARQLHAGDLERLDLVLCADSDNLADVRRLARRAAGPGAGRAGAGQGSDARSAGESGAGGPVGSAAGEAAGRGDAGGPDIRLMRSFDPSSPAGAEVPDPWGYPDAAFDESLEIIERTCRGLVAWLLSAPNNSPLRGRPS